MNEVLALILKQDITYIANRACNSKEEFELLDNLSYLKGSEEYDRIEEYAQYQKNHMSIKGWLNFHYLKSNCGDKIPFHIHMYLSALTRIILYMVMEIEMHSYKFKNISSKFNATDDLKLFIRTVVKSQNSIDQLEKLIGANYGDFKKDVLSGLNSMGMDDKHAKQWFSLLPDLNYDKSVKKPYLKVLCRTLLHILFTDMIVDEQYVEMDKILNSVPHNSYPKSIEDVKILRKDSIKYLKKLQENIDVYGSCIYSDSLRKKYFMRAKIANIININLFDKSIRNNEVYFFSRYDLLKIHQYYGYI